jgi:hypothetical protein
MSLWLAGQLGTHSGTVLLHPSSPHASVAAIPRAPTIRSHCHHGRARIRSSRWDIGASIPLKEFEVIEMLLSGPNPPAPFPIREGGAEPAFLLAYPPSRVGKGGQGIRSLTVFLIFPAPFPMKEGVEERI